MAEMRIIEIGQDPDRTAELDMAAAFAIRREVFCVEQGVSETEEMDGRDEHCRHFLAIAAGTAIGTARTQTLPGGGTKIERVAVLKPHRRSGIGRLLMIHIMDTSSPTMVLNAQIAVQQFYAELGFIAEGAIFEEAGIDHVHMTKQG
jgi:predicted GNAT family N-acyltransferase